MAKPLQQFSWLEPGFSRTEVRQSRIVCVCVCACDMDGIYSNRCHDARKSRWITMSTRLNESLSILAPAIRHPYDRHTAR